MINTFLPIPEMHLSVRRPIVTQVIQDLMRKSVVPRSTTIHFAGYTEGIPAVGSAIEETGKELPTYGDSTKYSVQVREVVEEDNIAQQLGSGSGAPSVFVDKTLNTFMRPLYQHCRIEIDITYRAQNRNDAEAWKSDMTQRMTLGRGEFSHIATYAYPLPLQYIMILAEIHRLRENQGGYGEDFATWLKNSFSENAEVKTSLNGEYKAWHINEHQHRLFGYYTFNELPEFEEKQGSAAHSATMQYIFHYDKPHAVQMVYPYVVHNQLLNTKYFTIKREVEAFDLFAADMTTQNQRYEYFRKWSRTSGYPYVINYPRFDRWNPPNTLKFTMPILALMVLVDVENPRSICNLTELGLYNLSQLSLDYISENPSDILTRKNSPFHISLYASDEEYPYREDLLTIDSNLNVSTTFDMDVRKTYRLVISVIADLSYLSPDAQDKLLANGTFCIEYLKMLHPSLENQGLLPTIASNGSVNRQEFGKALRQIRFTHETIKDGKYINNAWVGNFVVKTGDNN